MSLFLFLYLLSQTLTALKSAVHCSDTYFPLTTIWICSVQGIDLNTEVVASPEFDGTFQSCRAVRLK